MTTSLSDFINSLSSSSSTLKLIRHEAAFYSPKIGKTYQTFTAHPKSRSFPEYMKKPLATPYKLEFLHGMECQGDGWVTFVKTSRGNLFRRNQIRKMNRAILGKQYQTKFLVYFLIGLDHDDESLSMSHNSEIKKELVEFGDIIIYNKKDEYDSLPTKTFAGYQFLKEKCKKKEYVAFQDDDVFIKINELRGHFKQISPGMTHWKQPY